MKKILEYQLFISILILNAVIFILFSPNHYLFELFLSLAFQITIGIFLLGFLFMIYKKWIGVGVSLIAILLLFSNIPVFKNSGTNISTSEKIDLKVAQFNVLKFNTNYTATINTIKNSEADLVSINEMTYQWKNKLEDALKKDYPYSYLVPQNNSFGIGIFSKKEIKNCKTLWFEGLPYISGIVIIEENKKARFLTAHTIPPTNKYAFAKRNNEIEHIKKHLKETELPKIVIGDFNAVSWSPAISRLKSDLELIDSRTSLTPSYPAWNRLFMIPIDHIFYSKEISCLTFNSIKNIGSDHYGIVGEYAL